MIESLGDMVEYSSLYLPYLLYSTHVMHHYQIRQVGHVVHDILGADVFPHQDDISQPPAMLPGLVPPSLTFSSELDFVPMPMAVTPVFFPSELPSQSLPPVHSEFSWRELASRSPSPIPQVLFFSDDANDAEYTSQPGSIDPSLLAIAPSVPATNTNFASSPDIVNPSDTPGGEVIVVSLALDSAGCVLYIAGKNGVPDEVVHHLYKVFHMLQQIRFSLCTPLKAGSDEEDTPRPDKGEETPRLEKNLINLIYAFSVDKFIKHLVKKYNQFKNEVVPAMEEYKKTQCDQWTKAEQEDYTKFQSAADVLDTTFSWATTFQKITNPDVKSHFASHLTDLATLINASASDFRTMLKDERAISTLTIWEHEIMKRIDNATKFPLWRYLSKVFSLSYHIDALLKNVTYSHRMAVILDSKNTLKVQVVDTEQKQFRFPISHFIIRQALARLEIADDIVDQVASTIWKSIQGNAASNASSFDGEQLEYTFTSAVHCEALLLNYIGVLKLSCYPCRTLFHTYNTLDVPVDQKFFTKGLHAKIYPHWSTPSGFGGNKDERIRSQLVEHVQADLKELLKTQNKTRCGSDSTDVSATSEDVATPVQLADIKSLHDALKQTILEAKEMYTQIVDSESDISWTAVDPIHIHTFRSVTLGAEVKVTVPRRYRKDASVWDFKIQMVNVIWFIWYWGFTSYLGPSSLKTIKHAVTVAGAATSCALCEQGKRFLELDPFSRKTHYEKFKEITSTFDNLTSTEKVEFEQYLQYMLDIIDMKPPLAVGLDLTFWQLPFLL
ncbi:hypothetical protein DEU56DRAFT_931560 [Suillus clintonianus]|uniref:uncharacterized protein n=1 Tax=Suillus clintonianus TaxID=1904413 RepID=UPI001B85B91E|nr:uncharacterized protein DEU56DRAFT_931560 [Suillus clintonianus]KAG2116970.1 hypothetical protein DEU56DRAFT_931560 [Suillus clintonianus]